MWLFDEIVGTTVYDDVFMMHNGERVGNINIVSDGTLDTGME